MGAQPCSDIINTSKQKLLGNSKAQARRVFNNRSMRMVSSPQITAENTKEACPDSADLSVGSEGQSIWPPEFGFWAKVARFIYFFKFYFASHGSCRFRVVRIPFIIGLVEFVASRPSIDRCRLTEGGVFQKSFVPWPRSSLVRASSRCAKVSGSILSQGTCRNQAMNGQRGATANQ